MQAGRKIFVWVELKRMSFGDGQDLKHGNQSMSEHLHGE